MWEELGVAHEMQGDKQKKGMSLGLLHPNFMFLLVANFGQISTWKIWFQLTQRICHGKKWPKFARFRKKKISNHQIFIISSSR
jgi:hypothetical protein